VPVDVAPLAAGDPDTSLEQRARQARHQARTPNRVVRRYRRKPSPLVRDSVRAWRTGRLDRVLAGDFDLLG
jgi:ATP-dependent Clp protease ATP-binding subunit ClpC